MAWTSPWRAGVSLASSGSNGAGKTTTLRCLLGLLTPDSGSMAVLGLDPVADGQAVREQVGVLLAEDGLYDRLSPYENLAYFGRIWRLPPTRLRGRIEEVLALLRPVGSAPGCLWRPGPRACGGSWPSAGLLLHRPRLLLLDEPFSGLDPAAAVELRERVTRLAEAEGMTVLLTTHDLRHVERCCTAVAIIKAGRVIASGSPP